MAAEGFAEITLNDDSRAILGEFDLIAPTISVSDSLATRMARHNRSLTIVDEAVVEGIRAIENEHRLHVIFDSAPKNFNVQYPQLTVEWPVDDNAYPTANILIKPEVPANEEMQEFHRLNSAFWLGVLACQAINESTVEQLTKARKYRRELTLKVEHVAIPMLGNVAVATAIGALTHIAKFEDVGIGVTVQGLLYLYYLKKGSSTSGKGKDSYLKTALGSRAEEMAFKHPAITREFPT